jgi:hypothetical protein
LPPTDDLGEHGFWTMVHFPPYGWAWVWVPVPKPDVAADEEKK